MTKPHPALHQQAFHFSELHLHTCSMLCFHFPSFLQMPAKSLDNPILTPGVLSFPHFSQDALRSQDTLSESHSEPDFLDLISEDTTLSPSFKHQPKCVTFLPFLILRSNKMVLELTKKKKNKKNAWDYIMFSNDSCEKQNTMKITIYPQLKKQSWTNTVWLFLPCIKMTN